MTQATQPPTIVPELTERPIGFLRPQDDQADRALTAIDEMRLQDAEKLLASTDRNTALQQAWILQLKGRIALNRLDFSKAESLLLQSVAWIWTQSLADNAAPTAESLRLVAQSLHWVGWLYRRQDTVQNAHSTHRASYQLRLQHGSNEELWQTSQSLGVESDLLNNHSEAQDWLREAITHGSLCAEEPSLKQASAWNDLAESFLRSNDYLLASEAAEQAKALWEKHNPGDISCFRAELKSGQAMLQLGKSLLTAEPRQAVTVLKKAVGLLASAHESLSAFGPLANADIRWCDEQKDFASRLLASITP